YPPPKFNLAAHNAEEDQSRHDQQTGNEGTQEDVGPGERKQNQEWLFVLKWQPIGNGKAGKGDAGQPEESRLLQVVHLEGEEQKRQRDDQHRKAAHVRLRVLYPWIQSLSSRGRHDCGYRRHLLLWPIATGRPGLISWMSCNCRGSVLR